MRSAAKMGKNLREKKISTGLRLSELPMIILADCAGCLIHGNVCSIKVVKSH